MSASREKKVRQELSSQEGYVDLKAQREAEEKAKNRKANALYITIAVVFVVVAAVLLVLKSGILEKKATAVTIDGTDYTPAQVDFFYYNAYSNVMNYYGSLVGLNQNTDLNSNMNDSAKQFLGVEEEGEVSWHDFLTDMALQSLSEVHALNADAAAKGFTVDATADGHTIEQHVQENVDAISTYAAQSGYSAKEYLTLIYGKNMTMDVFKDTLQKALFAEEYKASYVEALTYTDADLETYYAANKADFDMGSYEYLYFSGTAASTKDAEGNTVEPTEAEKNAAAEQAKTDAAAVLERVNAGEKLEEVAKDYESASYYHATGTTTANASSPVDQWVYDAERQAGDTTIVEKDAARYVVVFENVSRPEYKTVNVRHILAQADTDALDKESETYDADYQNIWDEAKAEADAILNEWSSGAATAESFAALAVEKSDDGGSAANGGLYEGITKTTNFVAPFLNWCFEDGRKVADTGIVETSYGYHIMYLDSFGQEYWKEMATSALQNEDTLEWVDGLVEPVVVTEADGMKYVG